jgi:hypothetical protein
MRSVLECLADPKADKTNFSKNFSAALSSKKLLLMGENQDSQSSQLILESIKSGWGDIASKWINGIHITNKPEMLLKIKSIEAATGPQRSFLAGLARRLQNSIISDMEKQTAECAIEVIRSIAAAETDDPGRLIKNVAVQLKLMKYKEEDRKLKTEKTAVPGDRDSRPLAGEKLKALLDAMPSEEKNRLLKVIKSSADKLGALAPGLPGADLGALCKQFDGVVPDAVVTQHSNKSGHSNSKETGFTSQRTAPTRKAREERGAGKDSSTRSVTGKTHPPSLSPAISAIEAFRKISGEPIISR